MFNVYVFVSIYLGFYYSFYTLEIAGYNSNLFYSAITHKARNLGGGGGDIFNILYSRVEIVLKKGGETFFNFPNKLRCN